MAEAASRLRDRPVLLAALGAACISSSAIIVRLADAAGGTTAFYRCLIALPGLGVLAHLERRRLGGRARADRLRAVLAGTALGVDLVLWTHAIYDVGAGVATVLGNLQVVFVALIAWVAFGERPSARFVAALPVVMVGVVLVAGVLDRTEAGYRPLAGILFGLGTSITYAVFIIVLRRSMRSSPHIAGPLADATFGAALAAFVIGLPIGELQLMPGWRALGWLALLAITSQTAGWLLITSALPRLPASSSSILLLLQPAAALLLAALILSEKPTLLQLAGAAMVCGGVLYAVRTSAHGKQGGVVTT